MSNASIENYNEVLKAPPGERQVASPELDEINSAEILLNPDTGNLHTGFGEHAVVYRCRVARGSDVALRCLLQPALPDAAERAAAIVAHLESLPHRPDAFAAQRYVPRAIMAAEEWRPAYIMEWVDGATLDVYVERLARLGDTAALQRLSEDWVRLMMALEQSRITHGELNHDNILVTPQGRLRLVGYDSVLVPALAGRSTPSAGSPGYQHPAFLARTTVPQEANVDAFAGLVILLSLQAIAEDPSIWRRYSDTNLLLDAADLEAPDRSEALITLTGSRNTDVQQLARGLTLLCADPARAAGMSFSAMLSAVGFDSLAIPAIPAKAGPWSADPLTTADDTDSTLPPTGEDGGTEVIDSSPPASVAPGEGLPLNFSDAATAAGPWLHIGRRTGRNTSSLKLGIVALIVACIALLPSRLAITADGSAMAFLKDAFGKIASLLFQMNAEAKIDILFLLIPLFLYTVARMGAELLRIRKERVDLAACAASLQRHRAAMVTDVEMRQWFGVADDSSPLVRAVQAVWNARFMDDPDLNAIAAAVAQGEANRSGIGRSVPNRLMLLSLLGTIAGLAGVVSTLQPQIQNTTGSPDTLIKGLTATMGSMGTAFSCTAWGILLASVVAALLGGLNSVRSEHLASVQRFAFLDLAPRVLPQSQAVALQTMQVMIQQSYAFVRHAEGAIKSAATNLNAALKTAGDAVIDGAEALGKISIQFHNEIRQFTTDVSRAGSSFSQSATSIETSSTTMATAAQDLQTFYSGVNEAVDRFTGALEGQIGELDELITQIRDDSHATTAEYRSAAETIAQSQRESAATIAQTQQAAARETGEQLSILVRSVREELSQLIENIESSRPTAEDWVAIRQTIEQASQATVRFTELMEQQAAGTGRSAADQQPEGFAAAMEPIRSDLAGIHQSVAAINRSLNTLSSVLTQEIHAGGGGARPGPHDRPPGTPPGGDGANGSGQDDGQSAWQRIMGGFRR